jgi:hypothetical protein
MKIKCPLCGTINYFSGIEEGTKFCSNCNRPLPEPKISDTTENPYIKIKKEETNNAFLGSKKMLDKETFSNLLVDWVVESLKIRRNGFFQSFLKNIEEFGSDKVMKEKFEEEIYYFYIWLAHINSISISQNKNKINDYFSHFIEKMYNLFLKKKFSGYEKEELIRNITKKINGYVDACSLFFEGDPYYISFLGKEFYKNLYGREPLGATTTHLFAIFVFEELKASFESLGKGLMKYKI